MAGGLVDFVVANPSVYVCLDSEFYGISLLASVIARFFFPLFPLFFSPFFSGGQPQRLRVPGLRVLWHLAAGVGHREVLFPHPFFFFVAFFRGGRPQRLRVSKLGILRHFPAGISHCQVFS